MKTYCVCEYRGCYGSQKIHVLESGFESESDAQEFADKKNQESADGLGLDSIEEFLSRAGSAYEGVAMVAEGDESTLEGVRR